MMMSTIVSRNSEKFRLLGDLFSSLNRFLLVTHVNPDGDALGSVLALRAGLTSLGKKVGIYWGGIAADVFQFLPGISEKLETPGCETDYDLTVLIDCHEWERVDPDWFCSKQISKQAVIDHHVATNGLPEYSLLDTTASAAGELIYRLLQHMEVDISPDIATSLFVAISTDTGSFSYANTTPESIEIASELVKAGAQPWQIFRRLNLNHTPGRMELLSRALGDLEYFFDGRVCIMTVTQEMMKETGTDSTDTDGFVEYPRSVVGVELAVFFREIDVAKVKVSLRSLGNFNAAALAGEFDGGGHVQAAGFTFPGPIDRTKTAILNKIPMFFPERERGAEQ